jgi:N-acetylglucosamine-6-sulfatase
MKDAVRRCGSSELTTKCGSYRQTTSELPRIRYRRTSENAYLLGTSVNRGVEAREVPVWWVAHCASSDAEVLNMHNRREPSKGQSRCGAGAQSLRASLSKEVAGLPNSGGAYKSAPSLEKGRERMWPPTHRTHARMLLASVATALLLASGLALVAAITSRGPAATSAERPNIVFIMTDDMPERLWSTMPTLRNQVAAEGVRFKNAYLTQSLCCPSRATTLTGKYPHNHGITGNGSPNGGEAEFRSSEQDHDTIATRVHAGGYRTALIGKYMNGYTGDYVPPRWSYWYTKVGRDAVNDNGRIVDRSGGFPAAIANKAKAFLDSATDQAEDPPFMLFYWTTQPHLPANAPSGYGNLFQDAKLPRPPSFNEADVSDKPAYISNLPPLTQDQIDQLESDHKTQLRNLAHVDDVLKSMLNLLRDRGELANTYIVFATDNGVHMGEHRYMVPRGSKSTPYEEAASTPLIIRGPGVPHGVVRTQLVANNDFAPTFAAWAGALPPGGVDGRSIIPLLSATPPAAWRTALLNERHLIKPDDSPSPNYDALFTATGYRYIEYATGEKELYDLQTDPYELTNSYNTATSPNVLASRLQALKSCAADTCRAAENGQ